MKNIISLCFVILLITGCCFNKKRIILEESDFKPGSRVLVYEDRGGTGEKLLRGALRRKGIKVLKYAKHNILNFNTKSFSQNNIQEADTNIEFYNKYDGTPYIIEINANRRNDITCLAAWDDGCVWELEIEITDLTTLEVVYSVSLSGFDEQCGYCSGGVFDEAATLISDFWNQQSKQY